MCFTGGLLILNTYASVCKKNETHVDLMWMYCESTQKTIKMFFKGIVNLYLCDS